MTVQTLSTPKVLVSLLASFMMLSVAGQALAAPWFDARAERSMVRQSCGSNHYGNGFRAGGLTRNEIRGLRQEKRQINRYRQLAYADGRISPAEQRRLQQMRLQYRGNVYREMNDGQRRW